MSDEKPNSILTLERPDLWVRALKLATDLTGYVYLPKVALPDGRLFACYSSYYDPLPKPKTPEEVEQDRQRDIKRQEELEKQRKKDERDALEREIARIEQAIIDGTEELARLNKLLKEKQKRRKELDQEAIDDAWDASVRSVLVPDGAMEWPLHEVGHWVAATPEERALPNYGLSPSETGADGDREWQAWAFQEIVLAPWGPARDFTAPTVRDGAGFSKVGPIAEAYMHHAKKRIDVLGLDVEQWRGVYGEWVAWGSLKTPGQRPWDTER